MGFSIWLGKLGKGPLFPIEWVVFPFYPEMGGDIISWSSEKNPIELMADSIPSPVHIITPIVWSQVVFWLHHVLSPLKKPWEDGDVFHVGKNMEFSWWSLDVTG